MIFNALFLTTTKRMNVAGGNLALRKKATQSSDYNDDPSVYPAINAVNGKLDDFTHTKSDTENQWWMVDLESAYNVTTVELYNRKTTDGKY